MKNVLVIGGSYFVGRVFVEELSKIPGYAVYVMNRGNVPLNMEGVIEIRCDRRNPDAMLEMIPSLMWDAVVDFCGYCPEEIDMMISSIPSHAIGHYIFISTASVYDRTHDLPVREESLLLAGPQPAPHGDYAYKKHLAEEELKEVCRKENIPWTILRPSFIYGKYNYAPRESYFFDLIFEGKALILPDNTPALFTFVSVWDVARAIIGIMGNRETHSQVFNLSGGELISYMRFADVLRIIAGIDIRIEMMSLEKIISLNVPLPFPLDEHLIYSGERITRVIDFSYTPFLEGLQATYHWYARTRKRLR